MNPIPMTPTHPATPPSRNWGGIMNFEKSKFGKALAEIVVRQTINIASKSPIIAIEHDVQLIEETAKTFSDSVNSGTNQSFKNYPFQECLILRKKVEALYRKQQHHRTCKTENLSFEQRDEISKLHCLARRLNNLPTPNMWKHIKCSSLPSGKATSISHEESSIFFEDSSLSSEEPPLGNIYENKPAKRP